MYVKTATRPIYKIWCIWNRKKRKKKYIKTSLSWMSKKQNSILLSTTEAEYIAIGSCCTQLLWIQKLLHDYGICQEYLTIYCDNTSAINISKNLIQHSRTKHIKIRHHFIKELVEDGTLTLKFVHTDDQKVDLLTKLLDSKQFEYLYQNIGIISMDWSLRLLLLPHAFASSFYALICLV